MQQTVHDASLTNSRLSEVQFGPQRLAAAVALQFTRSVRFWESAEGEGELATLASGLVPCEGAGRKLVCRYLACARIGLRREPELGRAVVGFHVLNLGLPMVWNGTDPLTDRQRVPKYSQYGRNARPGELFTSPLETLERVLSQRCAISGCNRPAPKDAYKGRRRQSARAVCCGDHESLYGDPSRRRVKDLLATAAAIVSAPDITQICRRAWEAA
jgi:hypothetical protein